jgi:hypothetical protein
MQTVGKALLLILREQAETRVETPAYIGVADRVDPQLATLMRRVADAQRALDAYVLEKTDLGGTRSK